MRIFLASLVLVAGLNLIVARSLWNPNNDYYDQDLFRPHSWRNFHDYDYLMGSDEKSKEVAENNDDFLDTVMSTILSDLVHFNVQVNEEKASDPEPIVKEIKKESEEDEHSLIFLFSSDDSGKSDELKPDKGVEVIDLTKSSEEKEDIGETTVTITDKDLKQLTEFLIVLSAIDELLKVSVEDLNKTMDENEYDSKEKDLKEFDNFLQSLIDTLEENDEDDDDKQIVTTTEKESSEEDYDFTTPKYKETTTKKDSSEEDYDVTTPKNDSSEEVEVETTTKKDSSEEDDDDVTTPKINSQEYNDSNEFNVIDFVALSDTSNDGQEENFIKHKYDIIDSTSSPAVNVNDDSVGDNDIVHQYVQLREVLDTEQEEISVNKLNLDKDFYNVISGDYNEEGLKKFEKDVVVLQENVERIKRHINGMENLNSKMYFKKLIKSALKDMQAKTNEFK